MPAYNPYYPGNYQPMTYQPQYYPNQPIQPYGVQSMAQQPVQPQQIQTAPAQPPIQNGGFIAVRNEMEARNWPVAPGNSVTFKDETAPYVYTKTATYNQLDQPQFVRYRLEREDDPQGGAEGPTAVPNSPGEKNIEYVTKDDAKPVVDAVNALNEAVGYMKKEIDFMKKDVDTMRSDMYGVVGQKKSTAKKETKKEAEDDA